LAFLPEIPIVRPDPAFQPADTAEFSGDLNRSLALLQTLAQDPGPSRRAGAFLRQARIHRKAGQWEESLRVYSQLAGLRGALIEGLPAEAIALQARMTIFEKLARREDARREARALAEGLAAGRWPLTEASYGFYLEEAARGMHPQLPPAISPLRVQLAAALAQAWRNRGDGQGRRLLPAGGQVFLALHRKTDSETTVLLLGPEWLERNWRAPLASNLTPRGMALALTTPEGTPVLAAQPGPATTRFASATRLPWNVEAVTLNPEAELQSARFWQRILGISLLAVALLVIAGSILIARSVTRELTISRLQSDFVAAVSHEFRTPLTSLCQISELFVSGRVAREVDRSLYYGILARESRRLRRLVEGLLDFGRMEAGAREYRFERIELAVLAREVADELAQENETHAVRLRVECPAAGCVEADRTALACVIWNLLDNALKYSGDDTPVRLSTRHENRRVLLAVDDEGPGIPPAEQSRIFDKFVRGEAARAANIRGSGIGLAMVKRILDAHRGAIVLHSEPGYGCTFTIELPEAQHAENSAG
jgi:signal transduction histidine kinase